MLGQVGIRTRLVSRSHTVHFPALHRGECDFFLLGWGITTFDSHYVFNNLYRTRTATHGAWNVSGYSDPEIDALIDGLSDEVDAAKRTAAMAAIWQRLKEETVYVPLHVQNIAYAMRNGFDITYDVTNHPKIKLVAAPRP
jgi:peptide/nickel transport system substrate-binding protein